MSKPQPTPVAYQALIAKLTALADASAQAIHFAAEQVAQECLDEKVASGEWAVNDGIIHHISVTSRQRGDRSK